MYCYNHPDVSATATCADCGEPICAACTRMLRGKPFCAVDYTMAGSETEDVLIPVSVPPYQREQQTLRMPPAPAVKQIEQPTVLIEQYKLTPNFVYQHAANTAIQTQDTASMLLQTEERQMPAPSGRRRNRWEETTIWAVFGLVCALIPVFTFIIGLDVYSGTDTLAGIMGLNALISVVSLLVSFWTILSRQDSSRPRHIIWIGLTSVIVLAILWISAPFLIHQKEEYLNYLNYLEHLRHPLCIQTTASQP